jgi:hypothetical protein
MAHDNLKITGNVTIAKNGKVVREVNNAVVNTGFSWIASRIAGDTVDDMTQMETGTGTTAVVVGNTALETPLSTSSLQTATSVTANAATTSTDANVVFVGTWAGVGSGADVTITEAGIFDSTTPFVMLARTVFTGVVKGANDTLTITWTISIAAS